MRLRILALLCLSAGIAFGQNPSLSSSPNPSTFGQAVTLTASNLPAFNTTVIFRDGGANGTAIGSVNSGGSTTVTFQTSTLSVGTHQLVACYNGDGFVACSNTVNQVVNSISTVTTLTLTPSSPAACQPVTLTANVSPSSATGTVTFFDGTAQLGSASLGSSSGGVASISLPSGFSPGNHSLKAQYNPDPGFGSSSAQAFPTVLGSVTASLSSAPNPSNFGQTVAITVRLTPTGCAGSPPPTTPATGTVVFFDGTTQIGTANVAGGTATFSTSTLTVGSHSLDAHYNGDSNYGPADSNAVTQVVNQASKTNTTTTLTTSANPITTTQSLTLTATVSPSAATGQVQFLDGATVIGTSAVGGGGIATLTIANIPAGNHPLTATYLGDNNFNGSTSNTVNETVNPPGKTNTTTSLTASPNPVTSGQPVTLTATVAPSGATGTVQFLDNGSALNTATVTNGTASFTTSNLTVGGHTLLAIYSGDNNFNGSTSNSITETVNPPSKTNTTTTLSTSSNPVNTGQPLTLTASVAPSGATGTVQFLDNGSVISTANVTNGTASLTISNLTVGAHTLLAIYSGDNNFNGSTSNSIPETVNPPSKTNTTTTLSTSSNPVNTGQPLTLTATVAPSGATGTVQFLDNGSTLGTVNLSNGTASLTTSSLSLGNHSLTAIYSGDTNFNGSTSNTVNQGVSQPTNQPTTITLSVAPTTAIFGNTVTMSAAVTPSSATGTVTFTDNGSTIQTVTLSNGAASIQTAALTVGTHTIVAVYSGNATFNSSSSNAVTVVINGSATQTTLSANPNPTTFGQTVTFTVSVSSSGGTPTGTVTFSDGDVTLGSRTLTGGAATFSTSALSVGTHTITASYSGDSAFNSSSSIPITVQITKATTTTLLTATPPTTNPGQSVTLTARVTPSTATGTVTFLDGTVTLAATVPLVAGSASFTTSSLTAGSHTLTAVYSGDTNFLGSTSPPITESVGLTATTTTLAVTPTSTTFGQTVNFTATVTPAGATGTVSFLDGTTVLGTGTLAGGTATFSTANLTAGTHSLTARYEGNSQFATSTSTPATSLTVGKVNSTTTLTATPNPSPSGGPVVLRAVVTPSTATGSVTFLDGGTTLGTAVISGGVATFTTSSLSVGTHNLTASYAGDANTNARTSSVVAEVVTPTGTPLGSISPTALPNAIVGVPYSQSFTVTGGALPLTWTLFAGSIPGLTLSPAGVLSGTPTTAGTTSLTIRVVDNNGAAAATVQSLTVLPLPSLTISSPTVTSTADQPVPQVTLSPPYTLPLTATFTLSFTPNAASLPANYVNPDVKFIGGSTTSAPVNIPAGSASLLLPAVQVGTVAGTITVRLATLTTSTGQSVLPANTIAGTIAVPRLAPVIVPGSVRIINITSTGFSVFLQATSTPRDLTTANLTFTPASGATLNGSTATVSLAAASTAWFPDTGANRGVANGGMFSLTMAFNYSGDPAAIGTVSVTIANSVGTSTAASGGR